MAKLEMNLNGVIDFEEFKKFQKIARFCTSIADRNIAEALVDLMAKVHKIERRVDIILEILQTHEWDAIKKDFGERN